MSARFLPPLSAWIAAALLSLAIAFVWMPARVFSHGTFLLEVEYVSNQPGDLQLYYDYGNGLAEENSARLSVEATATPKRIRFELPSGILTGMRLDPIGGGGTMVISSARIVNRAGRTRLQLKGADFEATNEIESLTREGETVSAKSEPGANDPNLKINLAAPIALIADPDDVAWQIVRLALPFFVGTMVLVFARSALGPIARKSYDWAGRNPIAGLALVSMVSTLLGSFPVVFLGRSFVSPNYGAVLLYEGYPTLPGTTDSFQPVANGSDLGAIMWSHIPGSLVQREALEDGEWPLWNRYNSTGSVLLGQGQSMFGDPLNLLLVAAGGNAVAWDIKFVASKFLFAFGMGLLALRFAQNHAVAALIAGSSVFIGFFHYRLNHPAIFSFCYSPWILVAWLGLIRASTRLRCVGSVLGLVAVNGCVLTSGTAKEAYILLLALNAAGAAILLGGELPWRDRLQRLAVASVGGVAFALATSPIWLTFADALRASYTTYDQPSAYQIHPSFLLGLFDEIFYRPLQLHERVSNPSTNFVTLGGVLLAIVTWRALPPHREARVVAIAAAGALMVAFGVVPPQWIVRIPVIANVAHIDNCFSLVAIVLLCPLAAIGFRNALQRLGTPEGRGDLIGTMVLLAVLVGLWISSTQTAHRDAYGPGTVFSLHKPGARLPVSPFIWISLLALPVALLAALYISRRILSKRHATAASVLAAVLCLWVLLWRHGQHANSTLPAYVNVVPARVDFLARSPSVAAVQADRSSPFRVLGIGGTMNSGWTSPYRLEGVSGPDALVNPAFRELGHAIGLKREAAWRLVMSAEAIGAIRPGCDFLGIRYYFDHRHATVPPGNDLTVFDKEDLTVYKSETAWPRAFFVERIETYDTVEAFAALVTAHPGQPFAAMLPSDLDHSGRTPPDNLDPPQPVAIPAHDYKLTTNVTAFTVQTPAPGLAVLQEAWLPDGFTVTLNGRPAPVLRVNHAFKGVQIPSAGAWRVVFEYRPPRFQLSLGLAVFGGAILLGLVAWARPTRP